MSTKTPCASMSGVLSGKSAARNALAAASNATTHSRLRHMQISTVVIAC